MDIIQSVSDANVSLKITFEFETFTTAELGEMINYDMKPIRLWRHLVATDPKHIILESTGMYMLQIYIHTYVCTQLRTYVHSYNA